MNKDSTSLNIRSWPAFEEIIEICFHHLRMAIRSLLKTPAFTGTAVATLAIGIGMSTAIFSVVDKVLLKPLPYPDAARIVFFTTSTPAGELPAASPIKFNVWREKTDVFQDVSAYRFARFNLTGVDHPEQVQSAQVTGDYFRLFGMAITRGRSFTLAEGLPKGSDVVIVSDAFWRRVLGGDPRIIGKTISLNSTPYEVIGISSPNVSTEPPPTFQGSIAAETIEVWTPLEVDPNSDDQSGYFSVAARLKSGVALKTASAELQVATEEFRRKFPNAESMPPKSVFTVQPMRDALIAGERQSLLVLSVAVCFVLLIACSNTAIFLLIRATARKQEIAVRVAVGASRVRILQQQLTESILLTLAGGVLGLFPGIICVRALLTRNGVQLPRMGNDGFAMMWDWRVFSFTILLSLCAGSLFGLMPALQVSEEDLSSNLKGRRFGDGFRDKRMRAILVIIEIALTLVLLIGAGLLIRSFVALRSVNMGFDPHNVLTVRMSLTGRRFQKTSGLAELVRNGVQGIKGLPGVAAAAFICCLPLEDRTQGEFTVVGRSLDPGSRGVANVSVISPEYFDVLKIPILLGRGFTDRDDDGASVIVISQALAKRFWPKSGAIKDVVGERLLFSDVPTRPWQIIGIAGDIHSEGLSNDPSPSVYLPIAQAPDGLTSYIVDSPIAWVVRTSGRSEALTVAIQGQLRQASGGLPSGSIRFMDEVVDRSTAGREFNMLLLSTFGCSALILSVVAVYGFMAYSVQQRMREIGIRTALGARPSDLKKMVLFAGMRLTLIGITIGMAAAFGLTRFVASFLFGVTSRDPVVFTIVPIVLTAVGVLAAWFPASHASRLDPVDALRQE